MTYQIPSNQAAGNSQTVNDSQDVINQKILAILHEIRIEHQENADKIIAQKAEIIERIDDLEESVTKKATIAGAVAGAIAGAASSGVYSIGMEFVKAKFGG